MTILFISLVLAIWLESTLIFIVGLVTFIVVTNTKFVNREVHKAQLSGTVKTPQGAAKLGIILSILIAVISFAIYWFLLSLYLQVH